MLLQLYGIDFKKIVSSTQVFCQLHSHLHHYFCKTSAALEKKPFQLHCKNKRSSMDKLRSAVEADDVKGAKHILLKNRDIDLNRQLGTTNCYTTLLILACESGCVDMVKLLTAKRKKPADVNMPDSDGKYPISEAVKNQHMKLLTFLLLTTNANPNVYCGKKCYTTPLIMACDLGNIDIVKLLIANKANVNMRDHLRGCPIWIAATSQNLELLTLLLRHTAAKPRSKMELMHQHHGRQPLIEACGKQDMNMVKLMLESKSCLADINMADSRGVRALSVALQTKNLDLVYMILNKGGDRIDLNYACDRYETLSYIQQGYRGFEKHNNFTPLMQAIEMRNEVLVSDLIKAGADVNPHNLIQDNIIDYSPLMQAVLQDDLYICMVLLDNGSDVNAMSSTNTYSETALNKAAQNQKPYFLAIVALLLNHGATYPISIKYGRNCPMRLALSSKIPEYVHLFMKHGYRFRNYPSPQNPSMYRDELCDAIEAKAEDCCVALLEWGFNVKANDFPYFRVAVGKGMNELVRVLIQLNPQFLQENWLIRGWVSDDSDSDDSYSDDSDSEDSYVYDSNYLLHKLQKERKQPTSLQGLCKATVLQNLISNSHQETISARINSLELLPTLLKQFLMLKKEHICYTDLFTGTPKSYCL